MSRPRVRAILALTAAEVPLNSEPRLIARRLSVTWAQSADEVVQCSDLLALFQVLRVLTHGVRYQLVVESDSPLAPAQLIGSVLGFALVPPVLDTRLVAEDEDDLVVVARGSVSDLTRLGGRRGWTPRFERLVDFVSGPEHMYGRRGLSTRFLVTFTT